MTVESFGSARTRGASSARAPEHASLRLVGRSKALKDVLQQVRLVAGTEATVLIHGETGTGKELVAQAVHDLSARRGGPFVKLNCSAIPKTLLESELMGHEKGAFTGALTRRIGRFERATSGTLFLDEVGELPMDVQPKLLRVLQEREFERLGGVQTLSIDTRLITATNRDLRWMVKERTFRHDLYYRLNVFPIRVPPLRERRQDIPILAEHFLHELARRQEREPPTVSEQTLRRLSQYDFPGNVRELQNIIERALLLSSGTTLEIPPLDENTACSAFDELAHVQRTHILSVLEETGWTVAGPHGAARRLGLKRSTLSYRMKKLGIVSDSRSSRHAQAKTSTSTTGLGE